MKNNTMNRINEEIIRQLGLQPSKLPSSIQAAQNARVFDYPTLENVYIMESDFYGNDLPEGLCFLAFQGRHGLLGTDLSVEQLRTASKEEIQKMVQTNT